MRNACLVTASFGLSLLAGAASATDLRIAMRDDPDILDPTLATTYTGRIVFAGLCDKLFDIDQRLAIVPQLATGYEWSDSQTLLIRLRDGVKFHDGSSMDAAAVKNSLERHLTMEGSFRRPEINQMDHIEIVDPLAVRVVLKSPSAPFVAQLTDRAGMILAPEAAKEGREYGNHPVCSGPFRFVERVPQDHVTLERFPGYWNAGAIHVDRVIYLTMPDSSIRLANLKAGAIDIAEYIVPTDAKAVETDPKLKLGGVGRTRLSRDHQQCRQWSAREFALWQGRARAQGIRAGDRSDGVDRRGVQRVVSAIGTGDPVHVALPHRVIRSATTRYREGESAAA
jgi:peptide/nickel transport system substrate-binding protein